MNKIEQRLAIKEASIARMKTISRGDKVTNICAGEGNPSLHSYFVKYKTKTRKNKFGIPHTEHLASIRAPCGHTGDYGIEVIYPGWLAEDKRKELFKPVWDANYS